MNKTYFDFTAYLMLLRKDIFCFPFLFISPPIILDSKEPSIDLDKFIYNQMRYEYLKKKHPDIADQLFEDLKKHSKEKLELYKKMAGEDKKPE